MKLVHLPVLLRSISDGRKFSSNDSLYHIDEDIFGYKIRTDIKLKRTSSITETHPHTNKIHSLTNMKQGNS